MSKPARALAVGAGVAFAVALIVYYIVSYLMVTPPGVAATGSKPRVHLTLQTVASFGNPPHPDWVSYLARNPSGKWVHSTILRVPADSTVTVTIYQFDTATGLRKLRGIGIVGSTSVFLCSRLTRAPHPPRVFQFFLAASEPAGLRVRGVAGTYGRRSGTPPIPDARGAVIGVANRRAYVLPRSSRASRSTSRTFISRAMRWSRSS